METVAYENETINDFFGELAVFFSCILYVELGLA